MALQLTIKRFAVENIDFQWAGVIRMRVEVSDPYNSGADPYVFIYKRSPINPYASDYVDDFHAVCSPADLSEWPIGEPDPDKEYPFFRVTAVELDFRASGTADEVWVVIVREINLLLQAQIRLGELVEVAEVVAGPYGDEDGSSDSDSDSV